MSGLIWEAFEGSMLHRRVATNERAQWGSIWIPIVCWNTSQQTVKFAVDLKKKPTTYEWYSPVYIYYYILNGVWQSKTCIYQ
jgi:hypothetical protein